MVSQIPSTPVAPRHLLESTIRNDLRSVLQHLRKGQLSKAGETALAQAVFQQTNDEPPSSLSYGVALREIILRCLDQMSRSLESSPKHVNDFMESTHVLHLRNYLKGIGWQQIEGSLPISRATYFRELNLAIDALAATLIDYFVNHPVYKPSPFSNHFAVLAAKRDKPSNEMDSLSPSHSDELHGRGNLLAEIQSKLFRKDRGFVCLWGLPGIGKTSLARAVAEDAATQQHFHQVVWTEFGQDPNISSTLMEWARHLHIAASTASGLSIPDLTRLISEVIGDKQLLFILDDVWTSEAAFRAHAALPRCVILTTTRFPELANILAGKESIHVDQLELEGSISLLKDGLTASAVELLNPYFEQIAEACGHVPLALRLARQHLRRTIVSQSPDDLEMGHLLDHVTDRRVLISQTIPSTLPLHASMPTDALDSISTRLDVSVAAISEAGRKALYALGYLGGRPYIFTEATALAVAKTTYEELDQLCDAGLINVASTGELSMHPLIAEYGLQQLMSGAKSDYQLTQERHMRFFLTEAARMNTRQVELNLHQIYKAVELAQVSFFQECRSTLGDTVCSVCSVLEDLGDFEQASALIHNTIPLYSASDLQGNRLLVRLASIKYKQAHYADALLLLDRLTPRCFDPVEECQALLLKAELLITLQDNGRAQLAMQAAIRIANAFPTSKTAYEVSAMQAKLALIEFDQGEKGHTYPQINILQKSSEEAQFKITQTAGLLAVGLGKFQQSLRLCQRCYDIARRLNSKHRLTEAMVGLGFLHYQLGNFQAALQFADQAIAFDSQTKIPITYLAKTTKSLVLLAWGHTQESKAIALEAHNQAEKAGNREHMVSTACQITRVAAWLNEFSEVAEFSQKALSIQSAYQPWDHVALARAEAAQGAGMGGHYVSAHDHLLEVSKYKSRVMPGVRTHLMAIQGECLLRLGQLAQARSVFDECLKAATASETPQYMAFALFGKARACDERSQESATQALSIYTRIGHIHEHTVSAWLQNAKWNPSILNRFKLWIPV